MSGILDGIEPDPEVVRLLAGKSFPTRICSECGMEVVNAAPYTEAHAERCTGKPAEPEPDS